MKSRNILAVVFYFYSIKLVFFSADFKEMCIKMSVLEGKCIKSGNSIEDISNVNVKIGWMTGNINRKLTIVIQVDKVTCSANLWHISFT